MKTMMVAVVLLAAVLIGCSGVSMNAEYTQLLDQTVALSAQTATLAEAGKMDPNSMTKALRSQSNVWKKFQDARDGKAPSDAPSK